MSLTILTAKSPLSTKLPPVKASISKAKPKKMIANRGPTTTGALKVQQMIQGSFVNSSNTMFHSDLLPFKQVYFNYVLCYLVGIEKQYSGITYQQSYGRKCVNRPTFIDWLSKHTELHHLIPQCIEIEEFERAGTSLLPAEEDESFSMSHLHHLQASFNSKVTDMKEAADLLSEYTKKVTVTVTVKDVANTAAPPPPVVPVSTTSPQVATIAPPAANAQEEVAPLRRGARKIKLSAKAQAAAANKQK